MAWWLRLAACWMTMLGGPTVSYVCAIDVVLDQDVIQIDEVLPDADDLWVSADDFARINGFSIKEEGACFQDLCIPIRRDADSDLFISRGGRQWFNASKFAERVQQAFVVDRDAEVWSFAMVPQARQPFLKSAIAPEFELKDRNGDLVRLSDYRGKKVLIITWASW